MDMHIGEARGPLTAYIAWLTRVLDSGFFCVQTVPRSTVSKRPKGRAGIAVAVLGW